EWKPNQKAQGRVHLRNRRAATMYLCGIAIVRSLGLADGELVGMTRDLEALIFTLDARKTLDERQTRDALDLLRLVHQCLARLEELQDDGLLVFDDEDDEDDADDPPRHETSPGKEVRP